MSLLADAKDRTMDITLSRNDAPRRSNMVVYAIDGRKGSVRFSKTLFTNAPATLTLSNASFAAPKAKETKEERKARLALVTPAERVAKMEARLARMKAQLAQPKKASGAKVKR
jgi:hypothetical protein